MIPHSLVQFRKALWTAACIAQGTDPASNFVVFGEDNEAAQAHNSLSCAISSGKQQADKFQNSVVIWQSKADPLKFGFAFTLPMHATRVGDRIYPSDN